jgi:hypothetical protein
MTQGARTTTALGQSSDYPPLNCFHVDCFHAANFAAVYSTNGLLALGGYWL